MYISTNRWAVKAGILQKVNQLLTIISVSPYDLCIFVIQLHSLPCSQFYTISVLPVCVYILGATMTTTHGIHYEITESSVEKPIYLSLHVWCIFCDIFCRLFLCDAQWIPGQCFIILYYWHVVIINYNQFFSTRSGFV